MTHHNYYNWMVVDEGKIPSYHAYCITKLTLEGEYNKIMGQYHCDLAGLAHCYILVNKREITPSKKCRRIRKFINKET